MKQLLINIHTLLWIITVFLGLQTAWFITEKIITPAFASTPGNVVDVNIYKVGGELATSPYARPIKVEIVK